MVKRISIADVFGPEELDFASGWHHQTAEDTLAERKAERQRVRRSRTKVKAVKIVRHGISINKKKIR